MAVEHFTLPCFFTILKYSDKTTSESYLNILHAICARISFLINFTTGHVEIFQSYECRIYKNIEVSRGILIPPSPSKKAFTGIIPSVNAFLISDCFCLLISKCI